MSDRVSHRSHLLAPRATVPAVENRNQPQRRATQGLPRGMLTHIHQYLLACFRRESPPRVSELARWLEVSLNKFVVTFHRATGMAPSTYLKEQQIAAAKLMLLRTEMPVDRVGFAAAFGTRRTFFREFHKHTGMSPARYRERRRIVPRS